MMSKPFILSFTFFLLHLSVVLPQQQSHPALKLVFYNVENFYDWKDDPTVNDEEFLPEGARKWTRFRFEEKASNIYKVFAAIGELDFPDIIGMAEVENDFVLDYLIHETPMKKVPLAYVHRESSDQRGIDACIIYRTDRMKLLYSEFIKIIGKNGTVQRTRDIVYASFLVKGNEVLHVFVNHWPSRRGGELESQQKRNVVAAVLKQKTDSLLKADPHAKIVITGDFNDEPYNNSISKTLKAQIPDQEVHAPELYNLSGRILKTTGSGTLKFKGNWSVFDQIIVSGSLLNTKGLHTCVACASVFKPSFLLKDDKTYMGFTLRRTFNGITYVGGYSDHLPVFLNLFYSSQ